MFVRSRCHVNAKNLKRAIYEHVDTHAILMTDQMPGYKKIGDQFADHQTVNHYEKEYV